MASFAENERGSSNNYDSEAEAEPQHEQNKFRGFGKYLIDMLLLFPLALAATIRVLSLT